MFKNHIKQFIFEIKIRIYVYTSRTHGFTGVIVEIYQLMFVCQIFFFFRNNTILKNIKRLPFKPQFEYISLLHGIFLNETKNN